MKHFDKKWYNEQCKLMCGLTEEQKEYLDYLHNFLPKWYADFSMHDSKILSVDKNNDYIELKLLHDYGNKEYYLKFYSPNVIENCNLIGSWCISDELYLENNCCEFHLMVHAYSKNTDNLSLEYFTIKCSNMELLFDGKSYKVF